MEVGYAYLVEEHLVEVDLTGDVPQGPNVAARRVQIDEEVGDPGSLRLVGIGAREAHAEVGEVGPRGPHLLAGEHPLDAVAVGPTCE